MGRPQSKSAFELSRKNALFASFKRKDSQQYLKLLIAPYLFSVVDYTKLGTLSNVSNKTFFGV